MGILNRYKINKQWCGSEISLTDKKITKIQQLYIKSIHKNYLNKYQSDQK